jgi:hypothetical protein
VTVGNVTGEKKSDPELDSDPDPLVRGMGPGATPKLSVILSGKS